MSPCDDRSLPRQNSAGYFTNRWPAPKRGQRVGLDVLECLEVERTVRGQAPPRRPARFCFRRRNWGGPAATATRQCSVRRHAVRGCPRVGRIACSRSGRSTVTTGQLVLQRVPLMGPESSGSSGNATWIWSIIASGTRGCRRRLGRTAPIWARVPTLRARLVPPTMAGRGSASYTDAPPSCG
jgi:hypothetical protein